ncbi:hydrogenase formation protein HypD [Thermogladius sp. 4427co]|uniref:hydrogenase formation protein HypD n=1 Tax=Thermogladius sp. 4427co TaxID=3450718 RepID=UPI003F79DAB1
MENIIKNLYERSHLAGEIIERIHYEAQKIGREIRIMNFCGTHEWTITHYGIRSVMPENIKLIAGPGCPVCITPGYYVDLLVKLSMEGYHILTYGDSFKLPGSKPRFPKSLYEARMNGGRVSVVYSFYDAISRALKNRNESFIFFAVGFETTMPSTAIPLSTSNIPDNLMILSAYRYTPPVMKFLLDEHPEARIDGVIAPGHVSSVIGWRSWSFLAEEYSIPTVVAGFEPLDVLTAILLILKMLRDKKPRVVNEYVRVVKAEGNISALKAISRVYERVDAYWRGIGVIPGSGAKHRSDFRKYDLFERLGLEEKIVDDRLPGCKCPEVTLGLATPLDCPLFMKTCKPNNPYGPCMVSSEGTCRIWAENIPVIKQQSTKDRDLLFKFPS